MRWRAMSVVGAWCVAALGCADKGDGDEQSGGSESNITEAETTDAETTEVETTDVDPTDVDPSTTGEDPSTGEAMCATDDADCCCFSAELPNVHCEFESLCPELRGLCPGDDYGNCDSTELVFEDGAAEAAGCILEAIQAGARGEVHWYKTGEGIPGYHEIATRIFLGGDGSAFLEAYEWEDKGGSTRVGQVALADDIDFVGCLADESPGARFACLELIVDEAVEQVVCAEYGAGGI